MPLRRLELKDFKSYRGTQIIDLGANSHFTCIIGPNGSGKSNLMDAISFVLGVRSSQLRSGQLKELIYRGRKAAEGESGGAVGVEKAARQQNGKAAGKGNKSSSAKPKLGKRKERDEDVNGEEEDSDLTDASGDVHEDGEDDDAEAEGEDDEGQGPSSGSNDAKSAWVMAVYEDKDGKEWRYKRSITHSGTSSYILNDLPIPALKYTQSLEKHNILVKAKNFLVFQGDVEAVASQSGKALCRLVDQISGSLDLANDYDAAKAANDKANEVAAQNYTKKRGMNTELKQWREQKDEAKRYLAMTAERRALVVQHLLWRLYHIDSAITDARTEIESATKSIGGLKAEVANEEKKMAKAKKEQAEANLRLKKQESEVKRANKTLEEKKPALLALETKVEHAKKKIATSTAQLKAVEKDEARQSATLESLRKDRVEAEKAAEAAAKAQEAAGKKKGVNLKPEQLAEYHALRATANTHAVEERKKLDALRRSRKKSQDLLSGMQEKLAHAQGKKSTMSEEASVLEERMETSKVKLQDLTAERQQVRDNLKKLQAERTRVTQLEAETNEKLQEVYNKLLQARVDRRESDREVKLKETLANLKRVFPGVRGRAIDLCKPTLDKYNQAVTVVLGRNIDSVIVDQERTAIECIEYLRNQRSGQATFIPLDTIQVKPLPERYRTLSKTVRPAIDSITCGEYTKAFQHICGTTLICDTESEAKRLSYGDAQDAKIVTLDGTVFHKSGLITGGQGQGQSKKFDQKEVQALEAKREALMGKLSELGKSRPKGHDDDALIARVRQLEGSIVASKDDVARAQLQLTGLQEELKSLDDAIKKLRPEIRKLELSIAESEREASGLSKIVEAADKGVFANFCTKIGVKSIQDYEDVQLKVALQASEARMQYDAQIARLTQAIKFDEAQLISTRDRLEQLRGIIARETTAVEETLEAERTAIQEEIEDAEADLSTQVKGLSAERERALATSTAVETARKTLTKAIKSYDGALKQIGAQNDAIEQQASERFAIYRRCRLEEIALPLVRGSLTKVPLEEHALDENEMDVDSQQPAQAKDYGIQVDFEKLDDDAQEDASAEYGADKYDKRISTLTAELERLAPNGRINDRLGEVENRLKAADTEAEEAKTQQKKARDQFVAIRKKRSDLFKKAFEHISGCIDPVYKELTKGPTAPAGGVAYLSLEDNDEPYLAGIKYHAMPPMKRFRDMEQLSGGEKTMAALALLFAIHSFQPSPFFVLDEVDAALDNTNVARIASYIRKHCGPLFQFIVISLKGSLYERSNSLVGIYRDQGFNSSQSLTLDLQKYNE